MKYPIPNLVLLDPFTGSPKPQLSLTLTSSQTHTLFVPINTSVRVRRRSPPVVHPSLQLVLPLRIPVPGALSLPVTTVIMYT
jgi:hypothetical protein